MASDERACQSYLSEITQKVIREAIFDLGYGKNTGFGLAISREILDITGISIREVGEAGRGARFEMTVPPGVYRRTG